MFTHMFTHALSHCSFLYVFYYVTSSSFSHYLSLKRQQLNSYLLMGKKKRVPGVSRTVVVSKGVSDRHTGSRVGLQNVKRKIGPAELANAREESQKRVRLELSGMSISFLLFLPLYSFTQALTMRHYRPCKPCRLQLPSMSTRT